MSWRSLVHPWRRSSRSTFSIAKFCASEAEEEAEGDPAAPEPGSEPQAANGAPGAAVPANAAEFWEALLPDAAQAARDAEAAAAAKDLEGLPRAHRKRSKVCYAEGNGPGDAERVEEEASRGGEASGGGNSWANGESSSSEDEDDDEVVESLDPEETPVGARMKRSRLHGDRGEKRARRAAGAGGEDEKAGREKQRGKAVVWGDAQARKLEKALFFTTLSTPGEAGEAHCEGW